MTGVSHGGYHDRELARLAARLGRKLLASCSQITTAESCSGGWIAKVLTDVPGSSRWFGEGFVTYSNEAKVRQLGVPRSILRTQGAVSEAVVRAMARGAIKSAGASHSIAVTGIAGPDGGVRRKAGRHRVVLLGRRCKAGACISRSSVSTFAGIARLVRRKTVRWALAHLLRR